MADLPEQARERLGSKLFTSDLSVEELVCIEDAGAAPLGLVMGSSIYHVGLQSGAYSQNMELTVLSQAMHTARSLAISRMEKEAEALSADGVVGVHFNVNRYEWGPELIEFIAIGTAVGTTDGRLRPAHGRPFASDLSGQQFWKLLRAGYRPVGLAMRRVVPRRRRGLHLRSGNCVYHVAYQSFRQWLGKVGRNAEMENFTQATYDAREMAMSRMEAEAADAGAAGVVGVQVKESSWMWGGHIIKFFALGTAVVRGEAKGALTPQVVLGLDT